MSTPKRLAIVHNLTSGGAVRMMEETNKLLSKRYKLEVFTPKPTKGKRSTFNYIRDVYFHLPSEYRRIASKINESNFSAVLVHHDSVIKTPAISKYLKIKSIYIQHEPPRELYEPLFFHAPLLKDKLVTLIRMPLRIIEKGRVKRMSQVIVNSRFSKKK